MTDLIELVVMIDNEADDGEGYRFHVPAVPRIGEKMVIGDPDAGYDRYKVTDVQHQYRTGRRFAATELEMVTVLVEPL